MNRLEIAVLLLACLLLAGCGSSSGSNCPAIIAMLVTPASATAEHSAAPPGNQVLFSSTAPSAGKGCSVNDELVSTPEWTSSDPADVQFSSTVNGLATCLNATSAPVTVTVTAIYGIQHGEGTAQLACQ